MYWNIIMFISNNKAYSFLLKYHFYIKREIFSLKS